MSNLSWGAYAVPPGAPQVQDQLTDWLSGEGFDFLTQRSKSPVPPLWCHAVEEGGDPKGSAITAPDPATNYRSLVPLPLTTTQFPTPSVAATPALAPVGDLPDVLVLVVDNAISLSQERFRLVFDQTRVQAAWIMDADWSDARVPFGRLWQKPDIDSVLAKHADDHDAILREMGQGPSQVPALPLNWANTAHGTQIADLAAGYAMGDPEGAKVGLLTVQLPQMVYWDACGATLGFFAVTGLDWMLALARAHYPGVPIVTTFSYSITGGPHDGSHYVESQLDAVIDAHLAAGGAPAFPLVPAGNSYDDQRHARAPIAASAVLDWRLPPGDRSSNILEIWVPEGESVQITVTAPDGKTFKRKTGIWSLKRAGEVIGRLAFEAPNGGGQRRILLILAPTDTLALTGRKPAPSGLWKIKIKGSSAQRFRAWIHRDDQDFGFAPAEPQSYFQDAAYEAHLRHRRPSRRETTVPDRDLSPIKRSGSLSGFSGGQRSLTVAGAFGRDGSLVRYSSAGDYSEGFTRPAPMLSAVSDVSGVKPGLTSAGNRSGGRRWRSGTSAAVPVVARWITRQLLAGLSASAVVEASAAHFGSDPDMAHAVFERQGLGHLHSQPLPGVNVLR
jgi:hypothetical protein